MTYDGLNRLVQRNVPETVVASVSPDSSFAPEAGPYPKGGGDYTMAADTYQFAYNAAGHMVSATNNNSHILRGYTPNGLLRGDTTELAKSGGGFAQYIFANNYDALNRRTSLQLPYALQRVMPPFTLPTRPSRTTCIP